MSPDRMSRFLLGIWQNFFDNPILTRELRRRMRGKALLYSIIGYIVVMTAASIMILLVRLNPFAVASAENSQELLVKMSSTGRSLFNSILTIQALLVLIIAPTITAGMTTGEKEKKTFDFLRVTTITPWMYILGCFLSTVFYVSLALLCALPLISLAFLYGGLGSADVLLAAAVLLGASAILSAFGLLVSSVRERTRTAQGIVVFIIFAAIFGGSILYAKITSWLGMGTGAGAPPAAAGAYAATFAGIPLKILLGGFATLGTMVVLLLIGARKLFEPDDTRALAHWQFALLGAVVLGIYLAMLSGTNLGNTQALGFLATGCVLLLVAAVTFGAGRMEVGDEMWHLKRHVPILRRIDQTIPYLVGVGLAWWGATVLFQRAPASLGAIVPAMIHATTMVSLAGFAFFCVFARWATAVAIGRKGAGRIVLGVAGALWIGLPLLSMLITSAGAVDGGVVQEVSAFLGRFSPFYVMAEGIERDAHYAAARGLFGLPGFVPTLVYGILTVVFLVFGEALRHRRWKNFDYHYDMPVG